MSGGDGSGRMGERLRGLVGRVDDRVSRWVVRRAPAPVVRRWTHLWAPLARYGGRTRGGSVMLARAIRLLTEPARPLPAEGRISAADIAQRVGASEEQVHRWARLGLLGTPVEEGDQPAWGPEGLERARLVIYLLHQGVDEAAMARAATEDRLPLLAIDLALRSGRGTYSAERVAQLAGVSLEFAQRLWRAMGLSVPDPGEPIYGRREVEALRVIGALREVFPEDEIVEVAAVMGRGLGSVAGAEVELFRRHLAPSPEAGSGDLEWALRAASLVDLIRRPAAALLEVVHLRHLQAAAALESVARVEELTGRLPGQVEASVGFADLVGFTETSERLSALQVGELAGRLLEAADAVMSGEVRLVKTIGDAVMFTARDPGAAAGAAIRLIEAAAAADGLPPLRAGIAHGPVLRRHGDYYGRTVNLASRLCTAAPPSRLLLAGAELDGASGIAVLERRSLTLRGIDQPVEALVVAPVGAASEPAGRG